MIFSRAPLLFLVLLSFTANTASAGLSDFIPFCKASTSSGAFYQNVYDRAFDNFMNHKASEELKSEVYSVPEVFLAFFDAKFLAATKNQNYDLASYLVKSQKEKNETKDSLLAFLHGESTSLYHIEKAVQIAMMRLENLPSGIFKNLKLISANNRRLKNQEFILQKHFEKESLKNLEDLELLVQNDSRWQKFKRKFSSTSVQRDVLFSIAFYTSMVVFAGDFATALDIPKTLVYFLVALPPTRSLFDLNVSRLMDTNWLYSLKDFVSRKNLAAQELARSLYLITSLGLAGYFSLFHDITARTQKELSNELEENIEKSIEYYTKTPVEELALKYTREQIVFYEKRFNTKVTEGSVLYHFMYNEQLKIVKDLRKLHGENYVRHQLHLQQSN